MPYQFIPYNILLVLSAMVTSALGVYGYGHRAAPGAKAFVASMFIGTLWSVANALEISALTLEHKLFWANMQYIAYALAPVTWAIMVLQFTEKARWVNKRNILLLLIIPVITCSLVWTDHIYGLVRHDIYLDTAGPLPVIAKEYSPWFWVHFSQCYLLNFYSLFLLLKTVLTKNAVYRTQSVLLLVGTGVIAAFNLLYITRIGPALRHDISPIIFSISGAIIAWGIFRFRLFNLVPIARNKVIEAMENAVVVIDAADMVVDVNPAAIDLFATDEHQNLVGKPLNELSEEVAAMVNQGDKLVQHQIQFTQPIEDICRYYEIHISPIKNNKGAFMGRVIAMNDITELKEAQEELNREQQELAVMAERDRMAKDLHDNLGQILGFAGIQIQAAQLERQRGNQELADRYLERLGEIIEDAHQEMRDYVYNTRADQYKKNSIDKLIKNQVSKLVDNSSAFSWDDITLKLSNYEFSAEVKMHIVSIVKEALNNIMKYACATTVKVSLGACGGHYELIVEDNGVGFESDGKGTGSGLCIMEERVRLMGGAMRIESRPGQGTKIIVKFPDSLT